MLSSKILFFHQALYACGSLVVALSVAAPCLGVPETPLTQQEVDRMPVVNPFVEVLEAAKDCPGLTLTLALTQTSIILYTLAAMSFPVGDVVCFLQWRFLVHGLCNSFIYLLSSAFGPAAQTILGLLSSMANPTGASTKSKLTMMASRLGILRWLSRCLSRFALFVGAVSLPFLLFLQTFVSFLYNLAIPSIVDTIGMKHTLRVSNTVLTIGLLTLALHETPTQLSGTFIFACLGICWGTTISVLWMVVSLTCKRRNLPNPGLYNGLFNWAVCCPQIVISLIGIAAFSVNGTDRTMFFIGSCGAFMALLLVPIIIVPDEREADFSILADDQEGEETPLEVVSRRGFSVSYSVDSPQSYGTMLTAHQQ